MKRAHNLSMPSGTSGKSSTFPCKTTATRFNTDFVPKNISGNDDSDMTAEDITHLFSISAEETSLIILSVIWTGNNIGAAYYDIESSQLKLMVDHSETPPHFSILRLLIRQIRPYMILTSCKTDERILAILRQMDPRCRSIGSHTTSEYSDISDEVEFLHLLPSIDTAYESGKNWLKNVEMPSMPKNLSESGKEIYFSSLIDFRNICMVKAAGGLLKFLEKKRFGVQLEDKSVKAPIITITLFSLKDVVIVDDSTLRALQIFQQENHPSVYKSGRGMKEGLSLYGIFNRCKSTVGSKELRKWFLLPTSDANILKQRYETVSFFHASKNMEVMNTMQNCLKNIKNVSPILSRMKTSEASINDWQAMYKTVYYGMLIGEQCRSLPEEIEIFQKISKAFTSDLFRIANLMYKIIDFEESVSQNHFVVKHGVDGNLDNMKRTYNGLPDFMTKVAYNELQKLSEDIQECSVIYLPQLGYLLTITQTEQMRVEKNYNIEGLEFMFISSNVVHYKSQNTRELDGLLGDTLCEITDYETQIMHRLQNVVLRMSQVVIDVVEYSAKLDCLIALSVVAKEFGYVCPELTTSIEQMIIIKGRHPLQELCVPFFVPNDVHSGGMHGKVKIITGPNASGKSVYLKQVALITYMAHIGSFIPAEKAQIPIVDHIFTCIQTTESISMNLSPFLIELNQVSNALNYATQSSLVIIDEFGKGTDKKDGPALLISSLHSWIQKREDCPHLFVSTHYYKLLTYLSSNDVRFKTMEVLTDGEELVFLYQLIDGQAKRSFAHNVALQTGLPKQISERAVEVASLLQNWKPIPTRRPEVIFEQLKKYASIREMFFKLDVENSNVFEFLTSISEIASSPSSTTTAMDYSTHNTE